MDPSNHLLTSPSNHPGMAGFVSRIYTTHYYPMDFLMFLSQHPHSGKTTLGGMDGG